MKTITFAIFCISIGSCFAADVFPAFSKSSFNVRVPTNTAGYISDPGHEVGTNAVYTLNGQIFTNASAGHIQTVAEGFSESSDKATPWKTLTELLAIYQQGITSNSLKHLYLPGSQSFIDEIYSDAGNLARFQSFSSSITNMQVLMGFDLANGFYAITQYGATNSRPEQMPYFFVQTNGQYFLSTYDSGETNVSNIEVFLNTHSVTHLLQ